MILQCPCSSTHPLSLFSRSPMLCSTSPARVPHCAAGLPSPTRTLASPAFLLPACVPCPQKPSDDSRIGLLYKSMYIHNNQMRHDITHVWNRGRATNEHQIEGREGASVMGRAKDGSISTDGAVLNPSCSRPSSSVYEAALLAGPYLPHRTGTLPSSRRG